MKTVITIEMLLEAARSSPPPTLYNSPLKIKEAQEDSEDLCPQGHKRSPENSYPSPNRACRSCETIISLNPGGQVSS